MGVCTADVDGDGFEDIYVTALERNVLYHNNRDGTFTDIAERVGAHRRRLVGGLRLRATTTGTGTSTSSSAATCTSTSTSSPSSARGPGMKGEGGGRPASIEASPCSAAPAASPGRRTSCSGTTATGASPRSARRPASATPTSTSAWAIAWFDFNDDGWPDLYVANDSGPNFLYQNQKDGTFKEVAFPMGVAVSEDGGEQGSMGVAVGDYDNVGRLSLYVTNFSEEYDALYHNDGDHFTDVSFRSKTARQQPPLREVGHVLLRLRQRRAPRPHRRPTGTSIRSSTSRVWAPPRGTGSAGSSTTTSATGRSRRWRPRRGRSSPRSG